MSLLKPKDTEEEILAALRSGELRTTELFARVKEMRAVTKQGFYAALRKLVAEEAVTIYQKRVALNAAWVKEFVQEAEKVRDVYLPSQEDGGVLSLKERESVSYAFASTRHLDTFWGHSQSMLINQTPASEPVYSYDPHYWFYIARPETERKLVEDIAKSGRQFLMTAGGDTFLDKKIAEDFNTDFLQYHRENLFEKRNYYVVVIGDYITEVWLDAYVAEGVEKLYAENRDVDEEMRAAFEKLLAAKAKHKIRISRSARRARELKAKMGKNFFVRK